MSLLWCQVFESIIRGKIFFHCSSISTQQFGMLFDQLYLSQLLIYFSQTYHCADDHDIRMLCLYTSTVPHQQLLKLCRIGNTSPLCLVFHNYPSDFTFFPSVVPPQRGFLFHQVFHKEVYWVLC